MTKRKSKKLKQPSLRERLEELLLGLRGQVLSHTHVRLCRELGLESSLSVLLQTLEPLDTLSAFKSSFDAAFRDFFAQSPRSLEARNVYQQGLRWIQMEFSALVAQENFDEIGEYAEYAQDEKPKSRTRQKGVAVSLFLD